MGEPADRKRPGGAAGGIVRRLEGRRVLLWGHGLEGKATEAFIRHHCAVRSLEVYEGGQEGIDDGAHDVVVKSPGIREDRWNEKYTSATELFLDAFAPQTIGITGTKGKSTTASMLHHVLKTCLPRPVVLVGNIGIPCLGAVDGIGPETIVVFELSCHQLDHLRVSPHVAVFLNFHEEHLDRYGTPERYFEAKAQIARHQKPGDFFFAGENVPPVETAAAAERLPFAPRKAFAMRLAGAHNQYNAAVVERIAVQLCGCPEEAVAKAIADFRGLPHRMEYLGRKNGVDFYDDSCSTIPEATMAALGGIANAKTVLIGGMDRGIGYGKLERFMREHPEYQYICMYDSGKRVYDEVAPLPSCHYRGDLAAAVALAKELTPPGGACVLSPAAASYGHFRNFEERGNVFRSLVS